ncbi:caspase family protein [Roseibium aggregatum]|uniref:LIC10280 family protein n=1 Tax=Roseibium aggregatum TaxID=187304 RepID=UPI001A8C82C6|nr:caspase family protein [Roseibium aggregatum]MBN8183269.1 caspase family protein [Roseibium aggregatum]
MNAIKRYALSVVLVVWTVLGLIVASHASEQRTALVIGNAQYGYGPLANPVNDALAIARALDKAGFEVILQTDANRDAMEQAIRAFGDRLKKEGGVGLFYYAGHGIQIKGENYLLPVAGDAPADEVLQQQSVAVSEAVEVMTSSHDGLNIVVLDACRNNPLGGASSGLSRIDSNARLFVSYSTSPGSVALDGQGSNSPFTKHLASAIATPALNLEETFKRTLKGVFQETNGQQTPWISSSFFGDFTFVDGSTDNPAGSVPKMAALAAIGTALKESTARTGPARQISGVYRVEGTNPNGTTYDGMLAITPEDRNVRLTWWIGTDVFTGVGEFAGRMLVVNWGDKHPVVYSFTGAETLDGEWADGSASEKLTLYSRTASVEAEGLTGNYSVAGRNPDGTTYDGTVVLTQQGRTFTLIWTVGTDSYRGVGKLDGNVLTVDWGDKTPVVYAVMADGHLKGLWAAGRGAEELTRIQGQ